MDWDKGRILTSGANKYKRCIKEAMEIRKRMSSSMNWDEGTYTPGILSSRDHLTAGGVAGLTDLSNWSPDKRHVINTSDDALRKTEDVVETRQQAASCAFC